MKWASRIVGVTNGVLFAYWSNMHSYNTDWGLWIKFMIVSTLGFVAGDLYRKAWPLGKKPKISK